MPSHLVVKVSRKVNNVPFENPPVPIVSIILVKTWLFKIYINNNINWKSNQKSSKPIERQLGVEQLPGAGAGAAGASIESGASYILRQLYLTDRIEQEDYVWTGEGRIDRQTMMGKLPMVVARTAAACQTPCLVLAGVVAERLSGSLVCESIHDLEEEQSLDPSVTKRRLTRRAEQIVRRLNPS